jgi:hypothetical protein
MIWEADAVVSDVVELFRMRESYLADQLDRAEIMHFGVGMIKIFKSQIPKKPTDNPIIAAEPRYQTCLRFMTKLMIMPQDY